jgi:polysaccharide biosynthesis transport protein
MSSPTITNRQLLALLDVYWQWRGLWIVTTLIFGSLGLVYALVLKADTWVASQGLIVRDEANGAVMRLGRFQSQTEMKTAQETIQEMARNTQVLHAALSKLGPEPNWLDELLGKGASSWPSAKIIEDVAKNAIEVRAPRGAEFGTTEVIYLDIKQSSRQRALELNKAVCAALEGQLQTVRKARADGVIAELFTARQAAERELAEATERLRKVEAEAGTDLSDLRGMTDTSGGGNTNKQVLDGIKSEIRTTELKIGQLAIDLRFAQESYENPEALLLTPGRLITEQPGLKKLREGLADATIKISELRGRFTDQNPLVKAALETEVRIRQQLTGELKIVVETISRDIDINTQQLARLRSQEEQLESRLNNIAAIRAGYSNMLSDVRARGAHLQQIQRELAEAQAARDAAAMSSLLTRLEEPILGERPLGPGKTTIAAGAAVGGLFFGLGIVFLLTPLDATVNYGRRRQDLLGRGRRRDDLLANAVATEAGRAGHHDGSAAQVTSPVDTTRLTSETVSSGHSPGGAQSELLAEFKMRASDVLVARQRSSRNKTQANPVPSPSLPAETVAAAEAVAIEAMGGAKEGRQVKWSELLKSPPKPANPTITAAAPMAEIESPASPPASSLPASASGTPADVAGLKPKPTPWTSSKDSKSSASDSGFANNALLSGHGTRQRKQTTGPVIEVVDRPRSVAGEGEQSGVESRTAPVVFPMSHGLSDSPMGTTT